MSNEKEYSILIVDDESINVKALTRILSPDYNTYIEADGLNAVKTAYNLLPDVIILDIIMPGMDGYEVIRLLKSSDKTKYIPIIFVTALSKTGDEEKGLSLGAVDYITKPFSPAIVELRVKNQINILKLMRENIETGLAEKQSRAQIDFLMRMSHEMLTPMNAAMGLLQIVTMRLKELDGVSEEITNYCGQIDTAHHYLLRLIYDLLDISGKLDGSFSLNEEFFPFHERINMIIIKANRDCAKKQLSFTADIDPSIPESLYGDEERFSQVLSHLLNNAIKFTPENGMVHVSAHYTPVEEDKIILQIEVADSGIGISEDRFNRIFNVFEQGDGSMTTERGGMGLGLPISKRISEMMGGQIMVESESGKGSKFTFTCKMGV